jgi:hypothetical protein
LNLPESPLPKPLSSYPLVTKRSKSVSDYSLQDIQLLLFRARKKYKQYTTYKHHHHHHQQQQQQQHHNNNDDKNNNNNDDDDDVNEMDFVMRYILNYLLTWALEEYGLRLDRKERAVVDRMTVVQQFQMQMIITLQERFIRLVL